MIPPLDTSIILSPPLKKTFLEVITTLGTKAQANSDWFHQALKRLATFGDIATINTELQNGRIFSQYSTADGTYSFQPNIFVEYPEADKTTLNIAKVFVPISFKHTLLGACNLAKIEVTSEGFSIQIEECFTLDGDKSTLNPDMLHYCLNKLVLVTVGPQNEFAKAAFHILRLILALKRPPQGSIESEIKQQVLDILRNKATSRHDITFHPKMEKVLPKFFCECEKILGLASGFLENLYTSNGYGYKGLTAINAFIQTQNGPFQKASFASGMGRNHYSYAMLSIPLHGADQENHLGFAISKENGCALFLQNPNKGQTSGFFANFQGHTLLDTFSNASFSSLCSSGAIPPTQAEQANLAIFKTMLNSFVVSLMHYQGTIPEELKAHLRHRYLLINHLNSSPSNP